MSTRHPYTTEGDPRMNPEQTDADFEGLFRLKVRTDGGRVKLDWGEGYILMEPKVADHLASRLLSAARRAQGLHGKGTVVFLPYEPATPDTHETRTP